MPTKRKRKRPLPIEGNRLKGHHIKKEYRWCVLKIAQNAPVALVEHYPLTEKGKGRALARTQGVPNTFVVWMDKAVVAFWEKNDAD